MLHNCQFSGELYSTLGADKIFRCKHLTFELVHLEKKKMDTSILKFSVNGESSFPTKAEVLNFGSTGYILCPSDQKLYIK